MKYFPLFHNIKGQRFLIVGGGKVATRRAKALFGAHAIVDVVSPVISDELSQLLFSSGSTWIEHEFQIDLIQESYQGIIAATDSRDVNQAITDFAKARGIAVNVADKQEDCNFIFPALIDREPLTVAVSNNGSSPVLTSILKQQIEAYVPNAFGELANFVGEHRQHVCDRAACARARRVGRSSGGDQPARRRAGARLAREPAGHEPSPARAAPLGAGRGAPLAGRRAGARLPPARRERAPCLPDRPHPACPQPSETAIFPGGHVEVGEDFFF